MLSRRTLLVALIVLLPLVAHAGEPDYGAGAHPSEVRAPGGVQDANAPRRHGQSVHPAGSCIGAVVNGRCHGKILDVDPKPKRCHGKWLNGVCTGPMF